MNSVLGSCELRRDVEALDDSCRNQVAEVSADGVFAQSGRIGEVTDTAFGSELSVV